MGRKFATKITVRCWKEHTCVGCGGRYAFRVVRVVPSQETIAAAATADARNVVATNLKNFVEQHPCPTCGLYQPDMVGAWRELVHGVIFLALAVTLGFLAFVYFSDGLPPSVVSVGLVFVCLGGAGAHLVADLLDPNAHLESNRAVAQRRLDAGLLQLREFAPDALPNTGAAPSGPSTAFWLALAAPVVAAVVATVPEAVRFVAGWPRNADVSPVVAGPGDDVTVYLPNRISSIRGYWRGAADVDAIFPGRPSMPLNARASGNSWGNNISVDAGERDSNARLWVVVRLPKDPNLADKTVQLQIHLDTESPRLAPGGVAFNVVKQSFDHDTELVLGPPGSRALYWWIWFVCWLGIFVLALGGSITPILRARAGKKFAPTTRVLFDE